MWADVVTVYDQLHRTNKLLDCLDIAATEIAVTRNVFELLDDGDTLHPAAVAYAQEVVGSFAEMYSSAQIGAYVAALLFTHEYEGQGHDSPIADFARAVHQQALKVTAPAYLEWGYHLQLVLKVLDVAAAQSLNSAVIPAAFNNLGMGPFQGYYANAYAQVMPAALAEFAQGELVEVVKDNEVFAERHSLVNLISIHWPVEQVGGQSKMLVPAPLAKLLDFYL